MSKSNIINWLLLSQGAKLRTPVLKLWKCVIRLLNVRRIRTGSLDGGFLSRGNRRVSLIDAATTIHELLRSSPRRVVQLLQAFFYPKGSAKLFVERHCIIPQEL